MMVESDGTKSLVSAQTVAGLIYVPQFVAGGIALIIGCALLPGEIPLILPVAVVAGAPTYVLARRRWRRRRATTKTGTSATEVEAKAGLPVLQLLISALPVFGLAALAFVAGRFTANGQRFACVFIGSGVAGQALGLAVGRLTEYGLGASVGRTAKFLSASRRDMT